MKNIFFLLLTFFLTATTAFSQFVPKGTSTEPIEGIQLTFGISVVNEDIVWGVYNPITSLTTPTSFTRTTDGGATWAGGTIPTDDSTLVALTIYAKDDLTAWVGMNNRPQQAYGKTFKTIDGGTTWQEQPALGSTLVNSFHFWTELEGISFGVTGAKDNFTVRRTEDGGITWKTIDELPSQVGESTWTGNTNNHYEVIGDDFWIGTTLGRLLHTPDRGKTWEAIDLDVPEGNTLNSIAFQDENNGIVISSVSATGFPKNGFGYRTMDGGKTWVRTILPENLENIEHVPGSNGVYIGVLATSGPNPNYILSYDGGYEWELVQSPPFVTVKFLSPSLGWAGSFAETGGMYKWEGPPLMARERKRTIPAIEASWFEDIVGTSFAYHSVLGDFDPGPAGEDIVWDFSTFTPDFTRFSGTWVDRAEVYGGEELPEATHFINYSDESSAFLKLSSDKAEYLGGRGSFVNELEMPSLSYTFPYTLGTTINNNNVVSRNGSPKIYETETIEVDAYGTLKTPQGDLENVIRTKLTRISNDSSQIDSTGIITNILVLYIWQTVEYYGEPLAILKAYQVIAGDTTLVGALAEMDLKVAPPTHRAAESALLEGTLKEDFDNGIPPTWQLNNVWQVDSATVLSTPFFQIPATDSKVAAITDDAFVTKSRLISPAIALKEGKGYQLSFDSYFLKGNFGGVFPESATVQISSNDQANWTDIYTIDGSTDWENITVNIHPSFSGWTVNVAFLYDDEGHSNLGWAVDNVALIEFADNDNDGFGSNIDCNDEDESINPGIEEIPNNEVDEDCDGIALVVDEDGDGYNSDNDCDDSNATVNADGVEVANNGIDEDCDGADLISCEEAPVVTMEQLSCTRFKIDWQEISDATYLVRLRASGDAEWYIVEKWQDANIIFGNLLACTEYEVQVAAFCDGAFGALSQLLSITTAGCEDNQCTPYDHTSGLVTQPISVEADGKSSVGVISRLSLTTNTFAPPTIQLAANPVTDQISVLWDAVVPHSYTVQLLDMTGKQIQQVQTTTGVWLRQDVTALSSGIYLLRVADGKVSKTFKVVKH